MRDVDERCSWNVPPNAKFANRNTFSKLTVVRQNTLRGVAEQCSWKVTPRMSAMSWISVAVAIWRAALRNIDNISQFWNHKNPNWGTTYIRRWGSQGPQPPRFSWRLPHHHCHTLSLPGGQHYTCVCNLMLISIVLMKDNTSQKRKVVTSYRGFWFLRNIDLPSLCSSLPFHLTSIDTRIKKDKITLKMRTRERKGLKTFSGLSGSARAAAFNPSCSFILSCRFSHALTDTLMTNKNFSKSTCSFFRYVHMWAKSPDLTCSLLLSTRWPLSCTCRRTFVENASRNHNHFWIHSILSLFVFLLINHRLPFLPLSTFASHNPCSHISHQLFFSSMHHSTMHQST